MLRRKFLESSVVAGFVSILADGGMLHPSSTEERLVVDGRDIRLSGDFVFDREVLFINCRFSGNGSFVVPARFNGRFASFHSCVFDNRDRDGTAKPWVIVQGS